MLKMLSRPLIEAVPGREGWLGAIQSTSDVTEWNTWFAPTDDIHGVIVTELNAAINKYGAPNIEQHSSQYGYTDADIAGLDMQTAANPQSRFLFDKVQAAGPSERTIIASMRQILPPGQMAVGTSSVAHAILHTKAKVLLYPDGTAWTVTGSFNLSASAAKQFNIVDVVRSRSRGELFATRIDAMFDWVIANEVQS